MIQNITLPGTEALVAPSMFLPHNTHTLTQLSRELMERIFLLLDIKSVLTSRLVNREFNEIVQSSILLQYSLACKAAGVIDNPRSLLSYAERLEALKTREGAWRKLNPVFEMTFDQPSSTSSNGLNGGAYFFIDNDRKNIHYCHLPSFPQDNPRWTTIPAYGPGESLPGIIINIATALYEHDLIINVIFPKSERYYHSLDLVLLKFSTAEYHPLACHPRIHVQISANAHPRVTARVVGDNLALVVHSEFNAALDELYIFNWKTGQKRLEHHTTFGSYSSCVFITPELLLVPNSELRHFEVWHIPPSCPRPKLPVQIISLKIPDISPNYSLLSFGSRGVPNPFLHSMPYFPSRPFSPSPEMAIITADLRLTRRISYILIMHRHTLLDTIQKWVSVSFLEQEDLLRSARWLTNKVIVYENLDPGNEPGRLDAQSMLVTPIPHMKPSGDSPTLANSQTSSVSPTPISADSGSLCSFLQVKWTDWGPSISRWLTVDGIQGGWMANSTGQRYAFLDPNPNDKGKFTVHVADFNPYNFKRNAKMMGELMGVEGSDHCGNGIKEGGTEKEAKEDLEKLDHGGVFSEEVYMGLKCVLYRTPDAYDLDVVFMDEERLLGFKLDRDRKIGNVKVLYFG